MPSSTKLTGADVPTTLPRTPEEEEARAAGTDQSGIKRRNSDVYDATELRGISSFEDAQALVKERYGDILDVEKEMGTGFKVLNGPDKDRLVGTRFIILSMDFNEGDMGPFVSFLAVTEDNQKFVVNDGSTGLYKQLEEYALRGGKPGGLYVPGGLRRSDYETEVGGKMTKASTYYLNI
jgi:hypothetical protein